MDPTTLLELFVQPDFLRGLAAGALAAGLLLVFRRPGWFLAWAVAAGVGLAWSGRLGWSPFTVAWSLPLAVVASLFAGIGAKDLARVGPAWIGPALFALSVLGVWGTVPDTERAAVLMGVTAGLLGALVVRREVRVGLVGPILAVAVLGYVVVTDGALRGGAIVGSLGALGMLVVAPAVVVLARVGPRLPPLWLSLGQVGHVIVSGRVAGRMEDPVAAGLVVAGSAAAAGGLLWWGARRSS